MQETAGRSIAYHVVGDGPTDLVYVADYFSNLVYDWESPHWRAFLRTTRAIVPPDPLRQARDRAVRQRA